MIAVEERPAVAKRLPRPPLPREHGAWGILLIPFATAVGVSGAFDLKVALLLASMLCFYVARTGWLKRNVKWTALLVAGSVACITPLLIVWQLWWLVGFGATAAALAFRKTVRSVAMQLLAVCGLTLTAPAAWYTATSRLNSQALVLWLLNALYFAGGVFYVKMHVAAAVRRKPFGSAAEKVRFGAVTLIYYGVVAVIGAVLGRVGLAYAPVVVRAVAGVGRLSPTLRIRRLGWTEVAYSIAFAVILIVAWR
ncbi:MAG TPA: YwiC-like family protein [Verrucomicrobiae bacterium]|nr:YwiC-like family protein [Verrucomicrobiae bacterium]